MTAYKQIVEDFYLHMTLQTEMDLPSDRQSLLHFFERMSKRFPAMQNFYSREKGEYMLEEQKDSGSYRWASIDSKRIHSGLVNPDSVDIALEQHQFVLSEIPYALSVSPLDCESLSLMFGFDFAYRGNHSQLLAEVFGMPMAFALLSHFPGGRIASYEPGLQIALDESCRLQCRVAFEPRTSASSLRTWEFQEEQLSVYFTIRHFGSLPHESALTETFEQMAVTARQLVDYYLMETVLLPLHQAIVIQ